MAAFLIGSVGATCFILLRWLSFKVKGTDFETSIVCYPTVLQHLPAYRTGALKLDNAPDSYFINTLLLRLHHNTRNL